jgi:endogenous inhibitor of DNA gyrase (YacG/DUF329 family)
MTVETSDKAAPNRRAACPICGKPNVEHYLPFCSRRCADVDLGRWLKGIYAIPARQAHEDQEESEGEGGGPSGPATRGRDA